MEELDIKAKKCALIRQTWYEAAKKRMKDGARLAFYEACFEYEFYGRKPEDTDDGELFPHADALLMFDMVVNDLQRDMEKAETIALRNRRNGMLGGRPRKSPGELSKSTNPEETQKNPQNPRGSFGVSTTLHYNNTTIDPDKSVSMAKRKKRHKDIERYDFFRVMFVFFYSGSTDPAAETEKFYNYYQARDWQVGRGQHVRDKVALAKTWEIKDCNPGLIGARQMYAGMIEALDPDETELLTDFVAMVKDDGQKSITIRMSNGNRLMSVLEHNYLAPMALYMRDTLKLDGYTLSYEYQ